MLIRSINSIFLFALVVYIFFSVQSVHGASSLLFFLFEALLLCAAWMVIFSLNPIYSVLFLVVVFLNGSILLFFLGLDFLAFTLMIVYIGAIAVLFLFVVMMLNIRVLKFTFSSMHYFFATFGVLIVLFQQFWFALKLFNFTPIAKFSYLIDWSKVFYYLTNLEIIGNFVYGSYFVDLLISSLILLVAMLGAVSLTISEISHPEYGLQPRKQLVYLQTLKDFKNTIKLIRL